MTMFNPEQFLDMQITGANDTKAIPVPVGEYTAVISGVKCRQWQSKKDPSLSGMTLDVTWDVDDHAVKELLGRDKITVRQDIMLEFTDSGGLDIGKGRNIHLGRLREAVDLNTDGEPFAFSMFVGRIAKINVSHRIDGDNIYAEVKSVAKLG